MRKSIIFYFLLCLLQFSCTSKGNEPLEDFELIKELKSNSLELTGEALSNAYCASCHQKPDPSLLDKSMWERSVLPDMRRRLGLINADDFGVAVGEDNDAPPGIYSPVPLITQKEWDLIQDYYLSLAPDSLPSIERDGKEIKYLSGFELIVPEYGNKRPTLTTLTEFNEEEGIIYLGDRLNQLFKIDSKSLKILDSIFISSPASGIRFLGDQEFELLTMGYMDPSNYSIGKLQRYGQGSQQSFKILADSLTRPVHFSFGDLTGNGHEEIVICNFGHHVGNLIWLESTENGFVEHFLNKRPGARKTILEDINKGDLNGNGKLDIILGSFDFRTGFAYPLVNWNPFLILENQF